MARALVALQFHRAIEIFSQACAVFPSGEVPTDDTTRETLIELLPESVWQEWGRLDRELYVVDSAYWPQLLSYLREHETQILQPERA